MAVDGNCRYQNIKQQELLGINTYYTMPRDSYVARVILKLF